MKKKPNDQKHFDFETAAQREKKKKRRGKMK